MAKVTIKVTQETRDLLTTQAAAAGLPLADYVRTLAERAARKKRMDDLGKSIRSTLPELLESYAAETAEWEATELTDRVD